MYWYIVYKGKPQKGTLRENLEQAGIAYFIPTQFVEHLDGDRMVEREEAVLNNLIFVHFNKFSVNPSADKAIHDLIISVDGLKAPYINRASGRPATVTDTDLTRFKRVLEARSLHAEFLPDAYRRFESCPKVRVKAGPFEGLEGRVLRIRHDRKLIIQLDDMAVAISHGHFIPRKALAHGREQGLLHRYVEKF